MAIKIYSGFYFRHNIHRNTMSNQVYQNTQEKYYPMLGMDEISMSGDYVVAGGGIDQQIPFASIEYIGPARHLSLAAPGFLKIDETGIYSLSAVVAVQMGVDNIDPFFAVYFQLFHAGAQNDGAIYARQSTRLPNTGTGTNILPALNLSLTVGLSAGDNIGLYISNYDTVNDATVKLVNTYWFVSKIA